MLELCLRWHIAKKRRRIVLTLSHPSVKLDHISSNDVAHLRRSTYSKPFCDIHFFWVLGTNPNLKKLLMAVRRIGGRTYLALVTKVLHISTSKT